MLIRPLQADDCGRLPKLLAELGYPGQPAEISQRLAQLPNGAPWQAWVAEHDDELVGFAHMMVTQQLIAPPFAELLALVVSERCRRQGVGQQLLAVCEQWAQAQGMPRLRIRSGMHRAEEAHRFYQALGYAGKPSGVLFEKSMQVQEPNHDL